MRSHLEKLNIHQLRKILKDYNKTVKVKNVYKLNKADLITTILRHLDVSLNSWSHDGFPILSFNPIEKSYRDIKINLLNDRRNKAKKKQGSGVQNNFVDILIDTLSK